MVEFVEKTPQILDRVKVLSSTIVPQFHEEENFVKSGFVFPNFKNRP